MKQAVQLTHQDHQPGRQQFPLVLLVHDVEVPLNIGSLFRLADALGLEKIWLTGTSPVPPNPKIRRTSRATEQYVAFEYALEPLPVVQQYRAAGYTIVSLEITSTSCELAQLPVAPDAKLCLILGAENAGVCQELLDASDAAVHIQMQGHNSSMNVTHACAIACYHLTQKMAALDVTTP